MHDTAYKIGGLVMATYLPPRASRILEIGSLNVNGGLRDHAPRNAVYTGLDLEAGDGVDHVVTGPGDWPVDDGSFDLVMASSAFEHDPAFWQTFLAMGRKTRPGGHIYISAPANGKIHRYPHDCWRFYPDAGLALQDWARAQGIDVMLMESFTADREGDVWNDFCAVFRRGPSDEPMVVDLVHERVPCINVLSWRTNQLIRPREFPQDMEIIAATEHEREKLQRHAEHLVHEAHISHQAIRSERDAALALLDTARHDGAADREARRKALTELAMAREDHSRQTDTLVLAIAELENRVVEAAQEAREIQAERDQLGTVLVALRREGDRLRRAFDDASAEAGRALQEKDNEIQALADTIATLESRLTQRDEEVSQAWQAAQLTDAERRELVDARDRAELRSQEERAWVLNLALARTRLERKLTELERAHDSAQHRYARELRRSDALQGDLARLSQRPVTPPPAPLPPPPAPPPPPPMPVPVPAPVLQQTIPPETTRQIEALQATVSQLRATLAESVNEMARQQDHIRALVGRDADSINELALLGDMTAQLQDRLADLESQNIWLREVADLLLAQPKWWSAIVPQATRRQHRDSTLQRRGLFDAAAYASRYPDVVADGQDPLRHFVKHGIAENRKID